MLGVLPRSGSRQMTAQQYDTNEQLPFALSFTHLGMLSAAHAEALPKNLKCIPLEGTHRVQGSELEFGKIHFLTNRLVWLTKVVTIFHRRGVLALQ